jgi:ribulose-phosphate 3-epimerase
LQVDEWLVFHGAARDAPRGNAKRRRELVPGKSIRRNIVFFFQPVLPEGQAVDHERIIIAPSLLAGDFTQLGHEAQRVAAAGADWLHLDIMDGHFVDNISFGPAVVAAMRKSVQIPLDVHLMISHPDHYLSRFVEAGAHSILVHPEAEHDAATTLRAIREGGCLAGLAINPETPLESVEQHLPNIDLLLVMTVHPGFGGQKFIAPTMDKVSRAAVLRKERGWNYHIEVDGGINAETALISRRHGANVMVAGTSVFGASNAAEAIRSLREG